ncbi:MAG: hypothetical protein H6719_33765 [Sandaracinaceae bacterium]|nr:hypothetical protein [Sandaracinaceae bacterium]
MSLSLGVNFPWVSCGHDFGPRPPPWAGAKPTDWARVTDELRALRALGLTTARWWVFGGGVNLPCGSDPSEIATRRPFGPRWPRAAERWAPRRPLPALPRAFLEDFERLLDACALTGVALWPSLVSFEAFLPLEVQAAGVTSRGRDAIVLDPGFFDATLEPMLDVCAGRPGAVRAFEVVNEPRWAMTKGWLHAAYGEHPPWVRPEVMSRFVVDGAERIARRGIRASVGFLDAAAPWLTTEGRGRLRHLAGSGRYVHQHHHYPSVVGEPTLPPAWRSAIRPVWVGELSTSRHGRWNDTGLAEDDDDAYLARRLALVEAYGYEGALLWARHAEDPHTRWDATVEAQVRAMGRQAR